MSGREQRQSPAQGDRPALPDQDGTNRRIAPDHGRAAPSSLAKAVGSKRWRTASPDRGAHIRPPALWFRRLHESVPAVLPNFGIGTLERIF
jgi:hypothetical protein